MAASNVPDLCYSCEICGVAGLSEEQFRLHTHTAHLEGGDGVCPFCGYTTKQTAELIIHVNQAHLDFLTPEAESGMSFIDDVTPSNGETNWNFPSASSKSYYFDDDIKQPNNLAPKVKGGASTDLNHHYNNRASGHGHGSPLRSSLALKLQNTTDDNNRQTRLQCPMCVYTSDNSNDLEEHVNRRHFDLTSPSVVPLSTGTTRQVTPTGYPCPLCSKSFASTPDLELHVNIEHRDVLSPASPSVGGPQLCPVCGIDLGALSCNDNDVEEASRHVESHFGGHSPGQWGASEGAAALREQKDFEMLRAQYGMDNQGNFREQFVTNMQRAVYAGEMSVADYYEKTLDLRAAESCGIDDGSSVTRSIVPRVRAMSAAASTVARTLLCTSVDHYASSYGDKGWGCGYRNTQMLISSLLTHTGYNDLLYKSWPAHMSNNSDQSGQQQQRRPPRTAVPSISRLQYLIERAWSHGFDVQGSEQLGCKLQNTRKWIGATEVVALLSFLRIKCQLVDFHQPTGPGGSHPELFQWVLEYFEGGSNGDFVGPLYLQHQGHSRTIMGVELHRDGNISLLVLDPSHSPQQVAQLGEVNGPKSGAGLRLLRKSEAAMKARQYQIVAIVGVIETDQQYQQNKVLRGTRVPQDR